MFTAKVTVVSTNHAPGSDYIAVNFTADYMRDGKEVNQEWKLATPAMSINSTLKNKEPFSSLKHGDRFTITFDKDDI